MLIKDRYAHLISLTQLFLLREFDREEMKLSDPATLDFFKKNCNSEINEPLTSNLKHETSTSQSAAKTNKFSMAEHSKSIPEPPKKIDLSSPLTSPVTPIANSSLLKQIKDIPIAPTQNFLKDPCIHTSTATVSPPKTNEVTQNKEFSPEPPLIKENSSDYRELWKICKTVFPKWNLSEIIPCDNIGKKNKNAWKKNDEVPPFLILSFDDEESNVNFLKNLSKAITLRLAPSCVMSASLLEKSDGWESVLNSPNLRLVIAGDYGIYCRPKLMQYYRELSHQGKHFLNQTPLLLLSDLSLYLNEPQLKPLLWRAICNEFATLSMNSTMPLVSSP